MRFRVSPKAKLDLNEIFVYWANRASVEVADRLLDEIEEHFAFLGDFPHIGRKCGETGPGTRCFPSGKYLIYYRKGRTSIEILHIFHGARDQHSAFHDE
jgi:toxin ParE1/3/4